MSYYICKVKPEFKDWQFQKAEKGISKEQFEHLKSIFKNLSPEEGDRYNLYSIQNSEYFMHLWHSERHSYSITFSNFPNRHKSEFVKYLYQICEELDAKLYCLGNDGQTAVEFDFGQYKEDLVKEYKPLKEKQYSKVEVDELIGRLAIFTKSREKVIEKLNLVFENVDTWENSINECYNSNCIVVRQINDWVIVIGKPENMVHANSADEQDELLNNLMVDLSLYFGKVGYTFNASKYSYFESFQFEEGKMTYKYIYGDGEEEIIGKQSKEFFDDFLLLTFDKSITEGVETYKIASRY